LFKLVTTEFRDVHPAYDLFDEFLRQKTYARSFCLRLVAVARQGTKAPWDVRRLAILMLENQILKLPPNNLDDFDFIFTRLNLKEAPGLNQRIVGSVLKEGYSTTNLRRFIPEFRNKLERLNHVHEKIRGRRTSGTALNDFIEASRHDCKLSLSRYLFTPEEVVDQVLGQLQVTDGMPDVDTAQPRFLQDEITCGLDLLPDFESGILRRLCRASDIYWASAATSSEINALVEYPLTTVVLVIKPPGSDVEFEIKRAGRKGANSLNVVYTRNGYTVPPSHRLDGGCMQSLLRFEANAASKFSLIYRLVHGTEAPIPKYISRATIFSIPAKETVVQTLPYFTEPQVFGSGFGGMRVAMRESVAAFLEEGSASLPELPGDLGLTARFISQVAPAQAILSGTSSFRLDKVAAYLSDDGPKQYFEEGLGATYSKRDARRLADAIIEEILGCFRPPDVSYKNHKQYLEAAFSVAENRARADRTYLSLLRQIAKFWGTLLAVRGYSRGESFVARNVGLKSCWDAGQWNVKIVFMDHDSLVIPGPADKNFIASNALPEMALDERYIWGGTNPRQFATSEVGYLQSIYRIGDKVGKNGKAQARRALKGSYRKTQHALLTNPNLRALFNDQFVTRLPDWDTFLTGYLKVNGDKSATGTWKKEMKKSLAARRYRPDAFDSYAGAIEKNREFLVKYRKVFEF
jgi:hypothetical protein